MYMKTQDAVIMRIRQLCEQNSLSPHALARAAGIPPTTLKNILYGNSKNPGIVTIKLLCDGLGISLFEFFDSDIFKSHEMEDLE